MGLEKGNLTKSDRRHKSPQGGWDVGAGYPTALVEFFYNFNDEDGVLLSPINLDLRAYNGTSRNYIKVGVHWLVLRPPRCSWTPKLQFYALPC